MTPMFFFFLIRIHDLVHSFYIVIFIRKIPKNVYDNPLDLNSVSINEQIIDI